MALCKDCSGTMQGIVEQIIDGYINRSMADHKESVGVPKDASIAMRHLCFSIRGFD